MTVVVITDSGSYLGKSKEQFKISFGASDKPMSYVPAVKVQAILVDTQITISSGAFNLLRKYGIPVFWQSFKDDGMMLQPFNNHGSVEVRKAQYLATSDTRAVYIAGKIVYAACKNKLVILKRLERRKITSEVLEISIEKMEKKINELTSDDTEYVQLDLNLRVQLMNIEAVVTKYYYQALGDVLKQYNWEFNQRSRRPAKDPFNALLNYLYAVLQGQLSQFIAVSGLDIFCGYLHTDRSGRESLVLDLIEEFRQVIVDELLLDLMIQKKLVCDDFHEDSEGVEITKEVKNIILPAFFERMNKLVNHTKLQTEMIRQPQRLSNFLRGFTSEYQPFLMEITGEY